GAAVMLVVLTLWLQCAGMALLIDWARNSLAKGLRAFTRWRSAMLMIRFTATMIVLHVVEIVLWAGFYRWRCLSTWESSFYFSAASYSTVGYGDVVLPRVWRLLGPIESVTGVLMSGISVSALFAILVRLIQDEDKTSNRARRREAFEDQVNDAVSINDVA
ncbi:MAG TPA: potassium channel family protein, partial [Terriglobales bacterium]|nr:potassium channel family protein [Terriglobales bacterium]